jgi:PKD repeat protein
VNQPSCQTPIGNIIANAAGTGPWNYYWKLNGTTVKTSLAKNSADTLLNIVAGNIDLQMNSVGMCDHDESSYVINEQVPPTAAFSCADTLDLDVTPSLTFTNSCVNSVLYFWTFGDGNTSTSMLPTHYYSSPGDYQIKLLAWGPSGCADTVTKLIHVKGNAVGINSSGINTSDLIVKTIGVNEYIFQQTFNAGETLSFKLHDASGRLVSDYGSITSTQIVLPVDLRSYSPGMYFMTVSRGEAKKVIKLPVK